MTEEWRSEVERAGVLPETDACSQKISGGIHLAATVSGLGLEPELVRGDALWAHAAHDAASLDAFQTAEELCWKNDAAARSLLQTAVL